MSTKKALIVVTSHDRLGDTGKPTGYYLPEVTHPYYALRDTGIDVDLASPKGGAAPMDPSSNDRTDPANARFLDTPADRDKLERTARLADVDPAAYGAILFAGGHGTMWDFRQDRDVQRLAAAIHESGGVVAAVCHGPAALVDVRLSSGEYLVAGKRVTGFSNAEEEAAKLTEVVPFLLESALVERGGRYEKAGDLWQEHVVSDGRVVTGQNPASAAGVGRAVAQLLAAP
ncbi:MAG TPA: type 1 glutamine amidotransferase domain-containing protein [Kofleriaceae bacterium]|nr:type 1 glutamine amidotransferase domain-containing protein [Kofleriaceae bacterium]